jgi:UDP-N-acetylmuramate dehydrogenase
MIRLPSGLSIERNVPLKGLTSWLVGGSADWFAQPQTVAQLKEALALSRLAGLPPTLLAGGTNVLISDKGVRGMTIALRKLSQLTTHEDQGTNGRRLVIECLSGTSKSELLKAFLKHRLEPALFLAGLPGDVGGGVVMNAGVGESIRPREFVEITDWIEVLRWRDGEPTEWTYKDPSKIQPEEVVATADLLETFRIQGRDLQWSYRHCEGWRPGIISRIGLSWELEVSEDILARVKQANQLRLSKQPLDMPSCGSVFINPPGQKAGQLVESSGLKGFTIGGAKVSEKHANFIVNHSNASSLDIHQLIEHVSATVRGKHGVQLRTEVIYLGDWT